MARSLLFLKRIWRGTTSLCLLVAPLTFYNSINALADDTAPSIQLQTDTSDSANAYVLRRRAVHAQIHGDGSDIPIQQTHDVVDGIITSQPAVPPVNVYAQAPAVQAQPPPVNAPSKTPSAAKFVQASNAAPSAPVTYTSPGIIVKRDVVNLNTGQHESASLSAQELGALIPAAGDETVPPSGPLIPLPNQTAPVATVPAPVPVTTAPVSDATPPSKATLEDIVQRAPETSAPAVTATPTPAPAPLIAAPEPAIAAAAPTPPAATEPPRSISKQSKAIVKNIPANVGKRKKPDTAPLNVEHAKSTDYLKETASKAQEEDNKRASEAMGIKIEVKTPPAYLNHQLELAYEALINGQMEEAIIIYKGILSNDANNKGALFGLATTYHRAGQIELARPLYGKLLSIDPNNRDALNNFLVLLADEAPEDALGQLQKLENKNPDFSPIPAQMAVIYEKMGNPDKASEKMFRAVSLAPENLTYRYNLAIMLDKQHNYDEAAKLYHQIVEAHQRGDVTPGDISKIQERLTFIRSNRS